MSQKIKNKKPPQHINSYWPLMKNLIKKCDSNLYNKYTTGEFSYDNIQTNYLLCNEKCRIVAIFKDYLVLDDNTEFLRRFYQKDETKTRLNNIFNFYETYSKIFPNYMILPESEYLYRNIRKKQKMIDAFNQIKLEEEENRKNLKIGKSKKNEFDENNNIVFDSKIKNSINKYKQLEDKNEDETNNSISISLMSRRPTTVNIFQTPNSSFVYEDSLASIAVIVNGMNTNNVVETPKRVKTIHAIESNNNDKNSIGDDEDSHHRIQSALNNNRKFISHKATVSVPEINNNSIKIINNYHNIIIPQGINTVININTNYYQCGSNDIPEKKKSSHKTISKPLNTIATSSISNPKLTKKSVSKGFKENKHFYTKSTSKSKQLTYSSRKKENSISSTAFKSPEKTIDPVLSLSKKKNITTTISTINHVMPIYKNKNLYKINTLSALKNKVNPFKTKFEKKKSLITNESNGGNASINIRKDFLTSFTSNGNAKKEMKISIVPENEININIETKNEMKTKYKNFIEKSKIDGIIMRKSYDTNNKMNLHTQPAYKSKGQTNSIEINSVNNNNKINNNTSLNSHRKITNLKSPYVKTQLVTSPKIRSMAQIETRIPLTAKIKLSQKSPLHKEMIINNGNKPNPSKIIKSINFKGIDPNTKKMKFVKK